jgi:DNA-binding GntR family transcriptional regulator
MEDARIGRDSENKPIRQATYELLKHDIIMGKIHAGSRLIETEYAERLHISRTPLREAFRKLELDGLVECTQRRGVVVRAFTMEDIDEIFSIRNALMALIIPSIIRNVTEARLGGIAEILTRMDAAQEAADVAALAVLNRAFHRAIEQISDKRRITSVIDSQEEYITRFSHLSISSVMRRGDAHREHHDLLRLLRERDEKGFGELIIHHLHESKMTCLTAVSLTRQKNLQK